MQKQSFAIKGMSCAACQARIEKAVGTLPGVEGVAVQLLQNAMVVRFDERYCSSDAICQAVAQAGYQSIAIDNLSEALQDDNKEVSLKRIKLISSISATLLLMVISMGPMVGMVLIANAFTNALVQVFLCLLVMALNSHYFSSGFKALLSFSPNMDSLVALGASASFLFSLCSVVILPHDVVLDHYIHEQYPLYFEGVATILTLVSVGKFLESKAKHKAVNAISALYDLAPESVCKRIAGSTQEQIVPLSTIEVGDEVILRPGDHIGVDGVVIEGSGSCDESALTGEARLVFKKEGSIINSATFLKSGYIVFKVTKVGADTTLAKVIALVDEANQQKAPICRIADRIAYYFVPAVIVVALATAIIWLMLGALPSQALTFAVSVLVVSCPCALGLAAPTAIMVATTRAASLGALFKTPEALEQLSKIDILVFDKTGTITVGKMSVAKFVFKDTKLMSQEQCFKLVLALEKRSAHPIAQALSEYCREQLSQQNLEEVKIDNFISHEGLGVQISVNNKRYYMGSSDFKDYIIKGRVLNKRPHNEAEYEPEQRSSEQRRLDQYMLVHLFDEHHVYASFYLSDRIKQSARNTVKMLNIQNIRPLLISGDRIPVVHAVAKRVGIETYKASCMPADKAYLVDKLKEIGHVVAMMGDGINDAPSLARSNVAISLAGACDIATSCADVILLRDELRLLPSVIELSRLTIKNIKENFFWAFIYNITCIPLAAGAFLYPFNWQLNPMLAALLMSLSSLCVVSNALRLRTLPLNSLIRVKTTHCKAMACQECENYAICHATQDNKSAVNPTELDMDLPVRINAINALKEDDGTVCDKDDCFCLEVNMPNGSCLLKDQCSCIKKGKIIISQTYEDKIIGIEGMSCPHCVKRVTKALNALEGVQVLEVSLELQQARVQVSSIVPDEALSKAIVDAGFKCRSIAKS